jgi:hypothetical protein
VQWDRARVGDCQSRSVASSCCNSSLVWILNCIWKAKKEKEGGGGGEEEGLAQERSAGDAIRVCTVCYVFICKPYYPCSCLLFSFPHLISQPYFLCSCHSAFFPSYALAFRPLCRLLHTHTHTYALASGLCFISCYSVSVVWYGGVL